MPFFSNNSQISSINSVPSFRHIIKHECKRVDRYNIRLSLIVFEVGVRNENALMVRRLVRIINQRVRSMDDIGWFDIGQIGVILPHTPTDGAFKLTEDISSILAPFASPPPFTIYSYPSKKWPLKSGIKIFTYQLLLMQAIFHPQTILYSNELRAYLNLELDRATRYNHTFSLLIFHLDILASRNISNSKIVKAINSRLRETDEFGWYGSDKIAAILPYADAADTEIIATNICDVAATSKDGAYTICTYPTNWFSEIKQQSDNKKNQPQKPRTPKDDLDNHKAPKSTDKTEHDEIHNRSSLQTDIDHFVASPIPAWKRIIDITAALCGMFFLSPVFLFAAIGIKFSSPGPILYRQQRVGYLQRKFSLLKFRTMHASTDSETHRKFMKDIISSKGDVPHTKLAKDKRIFTFGHFLRRTSIDELPQFFNVLVGEMSLVGPRPCLTYEAEEFLNWHTRRFFIMPGLTGLWQVSGKNKLSFKQMIRLDIQYEKNFSFWLDLKIIVKTIPALISIFFVDSE